MPSKIRSHQDGKLFIVIIACYGRQCLTYHITQQNHTRSDMAHSIIRDNILVNQII